MTKLNHYYLLKHNNKDKCVHFTGINNNCIAKEHAVNGAPPKVTRTDNISDSARALTIFR